MIQGICQDADDLPDRTPAVHDLFQTVAEQIRQCAGLFGICKLFHITQIYRLFIQRKGISAKGLDFHVFMPAVVSRTAAPLISAAAVLSAAVVWGEDPVLVRRPESGSLGPGRGMLQTEFFYMVSDIHGAVTVHLKDLVCNVEEGPGASRHEDCGDSSLFIEISGALQKRRDGLLFPG